MTTHEVVSEEQWTEARRQCAEPERRERLLRLSRGLRAKLVDAGISIPPGSSQIIPLVLGDNDRAMGVSMWKRLVKSLARAS